VNYFKFTLENDKIHGKTTEWIVSFVMAADSDGGTGKEKYRLDMSFQELRSQSSAFINSLLKDAGTAIEYRTLDGQDMTEQFRCVLIRIA
jgi:hypothetical protein